MDSFASLLQSEIASKKRQLDEVNGNSKGNKTASGKKYVRRADIERMREEEYLREQQLTEERNQKRLAEQRALRDPSSGASTPSRDNSKNGGNEDDAAISATSSSGDAEAGETGITEELSRLSNEEVSRRLRKKDEPIRLFGETEKQRRIRLRALEVIEERSEGQRNDYMKELEKVDAMMAHGKHANRTEATSSQKRWLQADVLEQLNETVISLDMLERDPDRVNSAIYLWTKRMLYEWELDLEERPGKYGDIDDVRRSNQGKHQTVTQRQSKEYLRPFFKQLRQKAVEPDVLARITEIVHHCLRRNYRMANDAYLRLSIGNSPWPIGVTMVGIHERSAREKIFASQVAHVLNDETQRKWIQCIKRLMTFSQKKYPPDDLANAIG